MVAELGDEIVGFMIYELHRDKIHVLDFATHLDRRRQGIGRQMIAKLIGKLSSQRRSKLEFIVRESSAADSTVLAGTRSQGNRDHPRAFPGFQRGCIPLRVQA